MSASLVGSEMCIRDRHARCMWRCLGAQAMASNTVTSDRSGCTCPCTWLTAERPPSHLRLPSSRYHWSHPVGRNGMVQKNHPAALGPGCGLARPLLETLPALLPDAALRNQEGHA
eukprot:3336248-Alexandrium_andersonii.AAC.1